VPLTDLEGHLFTLHVHGLDAFEPLTSDEMNAPPSAKRIGVRFTFEGGESPQSLKFVGMLYRDTSLERRVDGGVVRPRMHLVGPDGKVKPGFICSTALGLPGQERCLLISCEALPRMDQARESSILFLGGFDSAAAMNNVSQPVTFLALSYPADDVEAMRQRLGSIDFDPPDIGLQPTAAV
jgi:hypothetical protein